jgi:hypothetical protein
MTAVSLDQRGGRVDVVSSDVQTVLAGLVAGWVVTAS